jgi:site-specific DNA-adenine methylase
MSGTKDEFKQGVSIRYTSSGGSSVKRFRSAIESMGEWAECLKNWEFSCIDAMKFIDKSHDKDQHGIYADPPWPEDGDRYSVVFTEEDQRSLASKLSSLENSKVVVRYGDHPLIRELYKEDRWTWIEQDSRSQSNDKVSEVLLLLRNRSLS